MDIVGTLMLLAGMLIASLVVRPLAERRRLPFAAVLVVIGFLGSEVLIAFGGDTGVRYDAFHDLIFYVFLPILVFEAAFKIDASMLWRNIVVILFFAIPILLLTTLVTAALVFFGIGHPEGFPWIAALLTGALLAATDSSPVTAMFPRLGVPKRLRMLMEGEDLFNDATAIVLFSIFVYIALNPAEDITLMDASLRFIIEFFGGMVAGLLVGLGFLLLSRLFEDIIQQAVISLVSAYASYLFAEQLLNVSGVMAVLITGLIMGRVIHNDFQDDRGTFVDQLWTFNQYLAESLVFLLMGITVTLEMFSERWLAMLIGIVAVIIARGVAIYGSAPLINRLPTVEPIPMGYRATMHLGGLRGAVTLALALSLPVTLDYWWTIQSVAFGVVIFTLFVQAPMMEPLLRRFELCDKA